MVFLLLKIIMRNTSITKHILLVGITRLLSISLLVVLCSGFEQKSASEDKIAQQILKTDIPWPENPTVY